MFAMCGMEYGPLVDGLCFFLISSFNEENIMCYRICHGLMCINNQWGCTSLYMFAMCGVLTISGSLVLLFNFKF